IIMKSKTATYFLIIFLSFSIFATFSSYSFGIKSNLKTSQGEIFDGLYANYTYDWGLVYNTGLSYVYDSGDLYNVTWRIINPATNFSWVENIQTRLISNSDLTTYGDGNHTAIWVFTNLTIGDLIPIMVIGDSDHIYNVTDELTVSYPGFGSLDVWILEDLVYATHAWYERSTGLLINGSFQRPVGNPFIFTLTNTNMFESGNGSQLGIPGFEIFLVLPIICIISLIIIWRRQKEL
ncbi:MAG: hypothetical protein ACFFFT_12900, partial [Candidatus Thorarchaeota archaeon]